MNNDQVRPPIDPLLLDAMQRKLHEQHDIEQATIKAQIEQDVIKEIKLKEIEHLPFKGVEADVIFIDDTLAAQLEAQGAGKVIDTSEPSPATQRVMIMDDAFRALPPKDQAEVSNVLERLKYLMARHGQNARFAIIYESIRIAASEGQ